jgi:hypothetical protein
VYSYALALMKTPSSSASPNKRIIFNNIEYLSTNIKDKNNSLKVKTYGLMTPFKLNCKIIGRSSVILTDSW